VPAFFVKIFWNTDLEISKSKINCILVFSSLNYSNELGGGDVKAKINTGEDDMHSQKKILIASRLPMLFLLINLCIACVGGTSLSPGAWVEEEDRISILDGGPHEGSWQTRDLLIHYQYRETTSSLQITGVIEFASYIQKNFRTLEHLKLNIHFLEANGIVLDTKRIKAFGYRRFFDLLGQMSFNSRFDLTQDTVGFGFSYHGRVTEGGGSRNFSRSGDRIDWDFFKAPRRRPPK
jgi:hypothetical protein